jgi:hypothetical protein
VVAVFAFFAVLGFLQLELQLERNLRKCAAARLAESASSRAQSNALAA